MNGRGGDVCSADEFLASDAVCVQSFTPSSGGWAVQNCPVPAPGQRECDIREVVLSEIPGSLPTQYRLVNWRFQPDPRVDKPREISLAGVVGVPKGRVLEVLAGPPGAAAQTRISVTADRYATHDGIHPIIQVEGPGEPTKQYSCVTQPSFTFPVYAYPQPRGAAEWIFERYFNFLRKPNRYLVSVESCGVRNAGSVVGSGQMEVLAYSADQYTLSLKIPALGRRSYSRSKTWKPSGPEQSEERVHRELDPKRPLSWREQPGTVKTTRTVGPDGEVTRTREAAGKVFVYSLTEPTKIEEPEPDVPQIELKRNGQAEEITASLDAIVKAVHKFLKTQEKIRALLEYWIPQVGWKFEWDLSFFEGLIAMAWGWKEHTDHRVYFSLSAQFKLTLIRCSAILSFGVKVGALEARLEGGIEDAQASIDQTVELNRPDQKLLTIKVPIDIPAKVAARAAAGIGWLKFEASIGIRTGINGEGGVRFGAHCELFAEVKWSGVKGFIITRGSPARGQHAREYTLLPEAELWQGTFPHE